MNSQTQSKQFEQQFHGTLSDYVTAITWSPDGTTFAATSASGEVVVWDHGDLTFLQTSQNKSADCVAFSRDGGFLAVGGQDGQVKIWRGKELITTLENSPAWVDKLAWSPTENKLAFSIGRYVQVWNADTDEIVAKLNFDNSSAFGIEWQCDGDYIAVCGHRGVKVWNCQSWEDEPYFIDIPSASLIMRWSPDGKYLAAGNMDRSLIVADTQLLIDSDNPQPWVMQGFPGKIRQIAWSDSATPQGASLLACASVDGIVMWEKLADDSAWEATVLSNHVGVIEAIAFAPQSFILASAATDGWLCLWSGQEVAQIITGVTDGFSCLAWHPQGHQIAAGGDNGDLLVVGC